MVRRFSFFALAVGALVFLSVIVGQDRLRAESAGRHKLPLSGTTQRSEVDGAGPAAASRDHPVYDRLLDAQLRAVVAEQGLTGDPSLGRDLPSIEDPMAQLGKKMFFTKALGGDGDSACATCHVPTLGGGDGLALSIGVGADDPDLVGPGAHILTVAQQYLEMHPRRSTSPCGTRCSSGTVAWRAWASLH